MQRTAGLHTDVFLPICPACVCACVCVHVMVWEREREREYKTVACRFGISMSSYGGIFYIRNKTTHFNLKRLISIASCGFPNNGIPPKFAKQQQPPSASFQIRPRLEEKKLLTISIFYLGLTRAIPSPHAAIFQPSKKQFFWNPRALQVLDSSHRLVARLERHHMWHWTGRLVAEQLRETWLVGVKLEIPVNSLRRNLLLEKKWNENWLNCSQMAMQLINSLNWATEQAASFYKKFRQSVVSVCWAAFST